MSEADFDILLAELSARDYIPDKTTPSQFTVSIAHEIPQPLIAELKEILAATMSNDTFHAMLARIADGYSLLENVASVLQSRDLIAHFIKAMRIEDPNATHQEVLSSINSFVDTLEPSLADKVHSILAAKRSEQNIDLLEDCAMEKSSWPQIIARIYELIQSQKPDVWERLGLLLDRVSRSDDSTTCSNYEEYIKRNFLDNTAKQELNADIDRAQMKHTLGL
ncbi:hypothetical protein INT43_000707 [Umbelopsis isabellina]|uniref:Uncharacterized protein n=1 Tax=Mortierella isabellina TaxID=91625 RepID=A0A8H7UN10_MORIS|nr:hypothetical protein INT43_000707 [Umbelopsis isabellina]